MTEGQIQLAVLPPWETSQFFTEEGLRDAQEYFFQTHAASTRKINEGRQAQGLTKSLTRRKLSKEIGEDFKIYTGQTIGSEAKKGLDAPAGIRGDLNLILKHIYQKIAAGKPITSPAQQDLTILQHPHGGLEVCYALVHYFESLLYRYASSAGTGHKTLRGIMDEELFKWVWRTAIAFMMAPPERKIVLEDAHLVGGCRQVPHEKQRVPFAEKLHHVGMYLLNKSMQESDLRYHIVMYYVIFLRQMQTALLMKLDRHAVDDAYQSLTRRTSEDVVGHPLVAIDLLMNGTGNSTQSFDDVLAKPPQGEKVIPPEEMNFINQFEDFANAKRLAQTLRKLIPDVRREAAEGTGDNRSLMPLLLLIRTMPLQIRDAVLMKLPGPMMLMLINRMANSPRDATAEEMLNDLKAIMDQRKASGEKYSIGAQATRAHSYQGQTEGGGKAAPGGATGGEAARRREDAPAQAGSGANGSAAPAAAAAEEEPPDIEITPIESRRLIVLWGFSKGKILTYSISPKEMVTICGPHSPFMPFFISHALKTGQIFGEVMAEVSTAEVERHEKELARQFPHDVEPRLRAVDQRELLNKIRGASAAKSLLALIKVAHPPTAVMPPARFNPAIGEIEERLGEQFGDFMRKPTDPQFAEVLQDLNSEQRETLNILQRVLRSQ